MTGRLSSLTEREKKVLRLLSASHDAKSAAAYLGLSVHTINERLRVARRKLGVSSSRAAARLLAEAERDAPKKSASKDFGEAIDRPSVNHAPPTAPGPALSRGRLIGGFTVSIVALTLVIALMGRTPTSSDSEPVERSLDPIALSASSPSSPPDRVKAAVAPTPEASAAAPVSRANGPQLAPPDAAAQALTWVELLDRGDWSESWRTASSTFRERISQSSWAARATQLDRPAGSLLRVQQYALRTASPPESDAGGSVMVQFQSTSETGARLLETVALIPDEDGWKVSAYFIHESPRPASRLVP